MSSNDNRYGLRANSGKVALGNTSPFVREVELMVTAYEESISEVDAWKSGVGDSLEDTLAHHMRQMLFHTVSMERGFYYHAKSGLPHAAHAHWHASRFLDFLFLGKTHGKNGLDLFAQPLRIDLPPIANKATLKETHGIDPVISVETAPPYMGTSESLLANMRVGDAAELDYSKLSPVAQLIEATTFMFGEAKYSSGNWKNGKPTLHEAVSEMIECCKRHTDKTRRGEIFDPESKCPHMAHVVWNLGRILDFVHLGMTHKRDGLDLMHRPVLVPVNIREEATSGERKKAVS